MNTPLQAKKKALYTYYNNWGGAVVRPKTKRYPVRDTYCEEDMHALKAHLSVEQAAMLYWDEEFIGYTMGGNAIGGYPEPSHQDLIAFSYAANEVFDLELFASLK